MFARVTKYKMKADRVDDAIALMNQLRAQILGMPGVIQFVNVMEPDGAGHVISIVESRESAEANAETVASLWGAFAELLESPPEPHGGDVVANWTP